MKTKTALSILSALTLLLVSAGCGDKENSTAIDTTETSKTTTTAAPTEATTAATTTTTTTPLPLTLDKECLFHDIKFKVPSSWIDVSNSDMCAFATYDRNDGTFAIQALEMNSLDVDTMTDIAIQSYKDNYGLVLTDDFESVIVNGKILGYTSENGYTTMTYLFCHGNYIYHFTFTGIDPNSNNTVFYDMCPKVFNTITFTDTSDNKSDSGSKESNTELADDDYINLKYIECKDNAVYFKLENKTNESIDVFSTSIALDGESVGDMVGYETVPPKSKATVKYTAKDGLPTNDPSVISGSLTCTGSKQAFDGDMFHDITFSEIEIE